MDTVRFDEVEELYPQNSWVEELYPQNSWKEKLIGCGVNEQTTKGLEECGRVVSFEPGSYFRVDSVQFGLLWISAGTMFRYVSFHNGTESGTALLTPGQFVFGAGGTNCLDNNIFFRCLEPVSMLHFPVSRVFALCGSDTAFARFLFEDSYRNERVLEEHLLLRSLLTKKEHILLTLMATFSSKINPSRREITMTTEELASFSGVTRQYYKKVLSVLEAKGIVSNRYGVLEMRDINGLEELLEPETLRHFHLFEERIRETL